MTAKKDRATAASGGRKLTEKQKRFVEEYLVDLNATQAAIRAGYSARRADVIGYENLRKPDIKEAIAKAQATRSERTQITADYVLKRLVEIDQMDVLDIVDENLELKPVSQWPMSWRRYISGFDLAEMFGGSGDKREMVGILKKIKWPDKVKNLELLGKQVTVQAFSDKVIHAGDQNNPIAHSIATKEELKKIAEGLASKV
jgi:phage terminase small subunit